VLGNFIQNYGVNCVQTEDQQNQTLAGRALRRDAASRRRARARAPTPRRLCHVQPGTTPIEAAASLGTRTPTCLVVSLVRVVSPPRRTCATHRADRRSDPRAAIRASVETPPYHNDIFVVSTLSPSSAYLRLLPVLMHAMPSRPTLAAPPPWTPSPPSISP
jgi:hypothetical protein